MTVICVACIHCKSQESVVKNGTAAGHVLNKLMAYTSCFFGKLKWLLSVLLVFGRISIKPLNNCVFFKLSDYCTDSWKSYRLNLANEKHVIGKLFTQRIEQYNLTLRTRLKRLARKTICYSRSVELHDKVIGEFISREHY